MVMFFSRRIGLSEDGGPIPILGGSRLTGRAGPFELGVLNIQQREFGATHATNFTVGRLKRNILGNSDIGVMMVNSETQDSPHFNRVIGADANLRFGQSLSVTSFLAKSFSPAGGPAGGGRDLAGRVSANYKDNVWDLRSAYTSVQEDFENEMGFVPRLGIRKVTGNLGRVSRPERTQRVVRQFNPHAHVELVWDREGNLESRSLDYHFSAQLQNSSNFEIGVNTSEERINEKFNEPFVINKKRNIIIPEGVYRFNEFMLFGRTDGSRRISTRVRAGIGHFYTGYRHNYELEPTFRWSHKLNTAFTYNHNNINLPEGHFKTNLFGTRVDYSFSTSMFLNAFIQYNNDSQQWSSNIRFNLIHRPLSDLFVVYNERRHSITGDLIDRALIAKFTYMIAR